MQFFSFYSKQFQNYTGHALARQTVCIPSQLNLAETNRQIPIYYIQYTNDTLDVLWNVCDAPPRECVLVTCRLRPGGPFSQLGANEHQKTAR